ncbi:MAG: class I tRNA ligase family protein, partial [Bacteroidales bacterium]|nr:class I tRNA ligase family protein [Bacteroidales bacterium]
LWWGQRIPAYYLPDGQIVVESSFEKAFKAAQAIDPAVKPEDLRQDEDVLDTWFSSWLWPISVFDPDMPGNPEHKPNADLSYYYPTSDLVTGPDIIFFWVARMIMAGNEFMNDIPFRNVYFTGIVRDKIGRKMSKTLGNSPDPLELIAKYGADAVRLGMLLCSSAGNDILYDESMIEQGRNFCGKIWNSFRLIKGWNVDAAAPQPEHSAVAVKWFGQKLSQTICAVEDHYAKFRISDALMTTYKLFWDDFCCWYLEIVKPAFGVAMDKATYDATLGFFEALIKMVHPIMPFITEELWQNMEPRKDGDTIMYAPTPKAGAFDEKFLADFDVAREAVISIREIRSRYSIPMKEPVKVKMKKDVLGPFKSIVAKLANVSSFEFPSSVENLTGISYLTGSTASSVTYSFLAYNVINDQIAKLEADLEYQKKFLEGVRRKLSNESFVAHAPEKVVAVERKKEADALSRIESLTSQINSLKNN